jgi:hypothetical protein
VSTSSFHGLDEDTLATVPLVQLRIGDGSISVDPFARVGGVAAHPDGFVWVQNDIPEVRWSSPTGVLQQVARWAAAPEPAGEEAWNTFAQALRDRLMSGAERPSEERFEEILAGQRSSASETLPFFSHVHAAPDGAAWLSEWVPLTTLPRSYLLFDPDGAFRGRLTFARPIRILELGAGHVLGVERNEWDAEAVVLYRRAQ